MPSPSSSIGEQMSAEEAHAFLESHDFGVLSLGTGDRGYGIPMAYTYDRAEERVVLGFVNPPDSKKESFAAATDEATVTVFTFEDVDRWESVIVTGQIRRIDASAVPERVPIMFFRPDAEDGEDEGMVDLDEFDRTWYELRADTISGRRSGR